MSISEHPATIVVDVANVMGARPDGWWRDRAGAAVRLHAEVAALAASGRAILPAAKPARPSSSWCSRAPPTPRARASKAAPEDRVRVVHAPGHGDDTIVAVVRDLPGRRVVVTADRELRDRCAAAGAEVQVPGLAPRPAEAMK